ncbi:MAG: GTPase ObgE [Eubacteriales bacterium]|nr:GTPase ObgE [Eubacteriales bacterium]MDD3197803.1 GTPase ObgE [Eubacteriales bacterium]MDD4682652.1 GTPase ObgE [Eubacteriales bacterium]
MFIDSARIYVRAGNGGNGMVSFHTEKYVPNGGPDGGDGGRGGSVVFYADDNRSTLQDFRFKRKYSAEDGEKGGRRKCYGKSGTDLVLPVPVGTIIKDADTGRVLADLTEPGQKAIIAKGGRGGKGNIHFANSVRQAPNFARAGEPGEEFNLLVELKLLADVGLVGYPNVGKSTLLSVITAAKPKIADYPFTTIEPNLGVVAVDDTSFVVADIPGLIEGAHTGLGLGLAFLRHIERTRMLIHVIDVSGSEDRDPVGDFDNINAELEAYHPGLSERPQVIALNKIDMVDEDELERVSMALREQGYDVFPMCAAINEQVKPLVEYVAAKLQTIPQTVLTEQVEESALFKYEEEELFTVAVEDGVYRVKGNWIENLVDSTNFDDSESLQYFQRLIRKKGVIDALERAGVKEGDLVALHDLEFEFIY